MSHEAEFQKAKAMVESLQMGLIKHLEAKPGIFKVDSVEKRPVERPMIIAWEQRNITLLPEDLKNFYMTSNGFQMSWSVKMENGPLSVGRLHINGIGQLVRLNPPSETVSHVAPSLLDLDFDSDEETDFSSKPKFSGGFRMFELDPCENNGKVCLVYREPSSASGESDSDSDIVDTDFRDSGEMKSEIWFLDRALGWHYLAETFTDYFRMMIMHLGIPHWQYAFTDYGIPLQSKQWFYLYAPTRLEIDTNTPPDFQGLSSSGTGSKITFDAAKIFRGKSDKKKIPAGSGNPSPNQPNALKGNLVSNRKPPVSSARSVGSSGSKPLATSLSSQSLAKSSR